MPTPPQFTWKHGVRVVLAMGFSDFVLKYRGSFLGFLWCFIIPLVKFLVIFHVFQPFIKGVPSYHLYLFLGLILWEHFSMITVACMSMLHEKATIIQKVVFPRMLLILSVGWTHGLILLSYFFIFISIALVMGIRPGWGFVYFPLILLQSTLLGLSVGMILSSYSLKYRDLQHLWDILLQVIFWLTPIVYPYKPQAPLSTDFLNLFPNSLHFSFWSLFDTIIRFQPLSILLHDARRAILYPSTLGVPSLAHAAGFSFACILLFALSAMLFRNRSRYFIQEY